jgi:pyruvate kinase
MTLRARTVCDPDGPSARIVATIGGPDSPAYGNLEDIVGFGTIRINLAFASPQNYEEVRKLIRRIRARRGDGVCILLDCVGPRVKLGPLPKAGVLLEEGKELVVTTRDVEATSACVPTVFALLPDVVVSGHPVLLAEGQMRLDVIARENATDVRCRVVRGGLLKKRGLNLPECDLPVPALSERDERDLGALIDEDIDMIALSFVRGVEDLALLRKFLADRKRDDVRVMAKIETRQAVARIDEIAAVSDALMVARGDLWAELKNPWALPRVTTQIIAAGRRAGIPVVTATQTLSSMTERDTPSRAEVDELYYLLHEGSDAIMGSEEFAIGRHPRAVVEAIRCVSREVDGEHADNVRAQRRKSRVVDGEIDRESAAVAWAEGSDRIRCIVVISSYGKKVQEVCRQRPRKPVVAITSEPRTARYLQLFGVYPVHVEYRWEDEDHAAIARAGLAAIGWRGAPGAGHTALLVVNHHPSPGRRFSKIEEIPLAE